jgi:hypothetical protein
MKTTPSLRKLGMGMEGTEDKARRYRRVTPESTAQNSCHFLYDLQSPAPMKIPDFSFLKFELENPNQRILKFAELFSVKYIGKEKEKEREREIEL